MRVFYYLALTAVSFGKRFKMTKDERRAERMRVRNERAQNKKAQKYGFWNTDQMVNNLYKNEISDFLGTVYGGSSYLAAKQIEDEEQMTTESVLETTVPETTTSVGTTTELYTTTEMYTTHGSQRKPLSKSTTTTTTTTTLNWWERKRKEKEDKRVARQNRKKQKTALKTVTSLQTTTPTTRPSTTRPTTTRRKFHTTHRSHTPTQRTHTTKRLNALFEFGTPPTPPPIFGQPSIGSGSSSKGNYDFNNLSEMTNVVAQKLWELIFQQKTTQPTGGRDIGRISTVERPTGGKDIVGEYTEVEYSQEIEMADDNAIIEALIRRQEQYQNAIEEGTTFPAEPMCHDTPLNLSLKCDNCTIGYPKVDLCVKFGRSLSSDSEFKCKINCGPGHQVASGFNKVKCTKKDGTSSWKHVKTNITSKTCVPIETPSRLSELPVSLA